MKFGVHLPQSGPAASAKAVRRVAEHAELLGFSDVWVSEHLALPQGAPYPPSSYILDPLVTLTWAGLAAARSTGSRGKTRMSAHVDVAGLPAPKARV